MNLKLVFATLSLTLPCSLFADGWTPYIGAGAGAQNLQMNSTLENAYDWSTASVTDQTDVGFQNNQTSPTLNLFAGIGKLFSNNIYLGFDLNASYTGLGGSSLSTAPTMINNIPDIYTLYAPQSMNNTLNWSFQLNTLVGYQLDQHWMPYLTLGMSDAHMRSNYVVTAYGVPSYIDPTLPSLIVSSSSHTNLFDANVGLGTRYYIDSHWFVKAETIFTYLYGNSNQPAIQYINGSNNPTVSGANPFKFQLTAYIWSADVGVGYQF